MDSSILDDHLHHQLIPHREQSTAYGISSSSSVHPQPLLPDKYPPPPIDPSTFWHHNPPWQQLHQENQMAVALPYPQPQPVYGYETQDEHAQPGVREKRHRCQLCNKRFDRPSTLKKHMLVHTGEKAWACEICGRRFSVSSNLNRHTRRCKEKWAKASSLATDTPPPSALSESSERTESPPSSSSSSSSDGFDAHLPPSPQLTDRRQSIQYETDDGTRSHDQRLVAVRNNRRRRKSYPVEPWIPASLVSFNLEPEPKSVPTPLPAVVPGRYEERNSYADTPLEAYHPSCWTGNLVGPSYALRSDELPTGHYCGKLLVF